MEIKPGWWRMENGEIVCHVGRSTDENAYRPHIIERRKKVNSPANKWVYYMEYADLNQGFEYLPDCTGFDWQPEPKYVPFDRETVPRDVWYKSKSTGAEHRIVRISDDCVFFTGNGSYMWHELLRDFTIDGKPAGRVVE